MHNRTAIEFEQQNYCIVGIIYFEGFIEYLMVLEHGAIHGSPPTWLVLIYFIDKMLQSSYNPEPEARNQGAAAT